MAGGAGRFSYGKHRSRVRVLVNRVSSPRELRIRAYRFKHIPRYLPARGNYNISCAEFFLFSLSPLLSPLPPRLFFSHREFSRNLSAWYCDSSELRRSESLSLSLSLRFPFFFPPGEFPLLVAIRELVRDKIAQGVSLNGNTDVTLPAVCSSCVRIVEYQNLTDEDNRVFDVFDKSCSARLTVLSRLLLRILAYR